MTRRNQGRRNRGFTVVELLLAMAGIAFLLLFVLYAIVHVTNLYSKGTAIRQINQVGRQVSDEISRQIRYGGTPQIQAASNRMCIGNRSYIWNTSASSSNTYSDGSPLNFVAATGVAYCQNVILMPPRDASTREMLGSVARVMTMNVQEPIANTGVYEFQIVLGTAIEQPTYNVGTGLFECVSGGQQFCAVGDFEATIFARKRL